jgi:hypothetical protein
MKVDTFHLVTCQAYRIVLANKKKTTDITPLIQFHTHGEPHHCKNNFQISNNYKGQHQAQHDRTAASRQDL